MVADSAFAALELLAAVRRHVCVATRLRLDANLFAPVPPRRPSRGRPPVKGQRLPQAQSIPARPATVLRSHTVALWYGRTHRVVEIASATAVLYHSGKPPVPICWILVRDPAGELEPQAFLSTDLDAEPADILQWFVSRWQVEVTFQETRAHLGVETQRQWSGLAIMRTTPALLGVFSLVTLWAHDIAADHAIRPKAAAWYPNVDLTFSDAIAAVRRHIWAQQIYAMSPLATETIKFPAITGTAWPTRSPTPLNSIKSSCGEVEGHVMSVSLSKPAQAFSELEAFFDKGAENGENEAPDAGDLDERS